jgi:hypothetical protein
MSEHWGLDSRTWEARPLEAHAELANLREALGLDPAAVASLLEAIVNLQSGYRQYRDGCDAARAEVARLTLELGAARREAQGQHDFHAVTIAALEQAEAEVARLKSILCRLRPEISAMSVAALYVNELAIIDAALAAGEGQ